MLEHYTTQHNNESEASASLSFHAEVSGQFKRPTVVVPAHLCRESTVLPAGTGLSALGVDLTREQSWCPPDTGDIGVSGVSVSVVLPPSRNTSLAPTVLVSPGDITKEGLVGLTNPGRLEEEPLPAAAGSVTWATASWLSAGRGTTEATLSSSRCSSASFGSAFPSLS